MIIAKMINKCYSFVYGSEYIKYTFWFCVDIDNSTKEKIRYYVYNSETSEVIASNLKYWDAFKLTKDKNNIPDKGAYMLVDTGW